MSNQVSQDLRSFEKNKPFQQISHPLYDHFGEAISMEAARKKLEIDLSDKLILFFGFIRKYKGLDLLLEALADERLEKQNIKLLIAGEYYENEQPYLDQIERLQLTERVYCHTHL